MILQSGVPASVLYSLLFLIGLSCNGSAFVLNAFPTLESVTADIGNWSEKLINLSVHGAAANQSYTRLADIVDKFGPRMSGSQALEDAIAYLVTKLKDDGLENVHTESAMVKHWVRGEESASLVKPRRKNLAMLGLGSSVGTPPAGLQAEAIVVTSFAELEARAAEARGKIVVYNQPWVSYEKSVIYRYSGASRAAAVGAVASLIRSITPFSINSPHTGHQLYNASLPKIPTACITVEDAEMLWRMANRGEKLEIFIKMSAMNYPLAPSSNTIAEIVGSKYPEQVVVVSGHFDSWDVGQGAMDDGAGAIISWQALSLIRQLGLRPKRTIRAIFWTAEEQGSDGARAYYKQHKDEIGYFSFVMESDSGVFAPKGLTMTGNAEAQTVISKIMKMLRPLNATYLEIGNYKGGDNSFAVKQGIPGGGLLTHDDKYFYFHHTEGDTMTVLNSSEMDQSSAMWAILAYAIADLEGLVPRDLNMN